MTYADWLPKQLPPWFQGPNGARFWRTIGSMFDGASSDLKEASKASFPDEGPADALQHVADDQQMLVRDGEAEADLRERLREAWTTWPLAGTPKGILLELKAQGLPMGSFGATILQHNGRYAQLDGSDNLVLGDCQLCENRQDLTGALQTPRLRGFTLDNRDQFYAKFLLLFPANVVALTVGSNLAGRLNAVVRKWRPGKSIFVGTVVLTAGTLWGWPTTQNWGAGGLNWGATTLRFIPPT